MSARDDSTRMQIKRPPGRPAPEALEGAVTGARAPTLVGSKQAPPPITESLEERQWRLKVAEAKARVAEEEDEWKLLVERARNAVHNEEREWERLRTRAALKSSGAFPAHQEPAKKAPELTGDKRRLR